MTVRILIRIVCVLLPCLLGAQEAVQLPAYSAPLLDGIVNLKVKAPYRAVCSAVSIDIPALQHIFRQYGLTGLEKKFPRATAPKEKYTPQGERYADLSLVYRLKFPTGAPLEKIVSRLRQSGYIEYAEPHFIPQLCYIPNDDSVAGQYALGRINAFAAWDIYRGDSNTVIGITDTGYDPEHPDLKGSVKYNYADPVNGIDDDNDGYTDNYSGWNTGSDTNDVTYRNPHGIHVSGLSSATADNGIGMAGTGFHCRFLPIRVDNEEGQLTGAYEGVVYAAEQGCSIINCSWGSNQYSELNEEIIRYASVNKNCLIICGAGNNNNERLFYPAAYEYALSVGSTDESDHKPDFSNFGYWIDIMAPGHYVLSTWRDQTYVRSGGTSMSSPVVAGAAAMLRSAFPSWNSRQIGEQLKMTATPVDRFSFNQPWRNKMGSGRLDMFRALTDMGQPAIVLNSPQTTDRKQDLFEPGDTIRLSGLLVNYLYPATQVNVEVSSLSPAVEVLTPSFGIGALGTLETFSLASSPVLLKVTGEASFNETVVLRLAYNADGHLHNQYLYLTVNADFIHLDHNNIHTSVRSNGNLGVNGNGLLRGLGFRYKNSSSLLYEGGLMAGLPPDRVVDNVRGSSVSGFITRQKLSQIAPYESNIRQYRGAFHSSSEASFSLHVAQRVVSDSLEENSNFIISEYTLTNPSPEPYEQLFAGIFTDWDIEKAHSNRAAWNAELKLGYAYLFPDDTLYAGVQLLGDTPPNFYAIDNIAGGQGGINTADGFDAAEKYRSLSEQRLRAGFNGPGSDVITVISGGPFSLAPGESRTIAFALLAAHSEKELFQAAAQAKVYYDLAALPMSTPPEYDPADWNIFPNPAGQTLYISIPEEERWPVKVEISDLSGRSVRSFALKNGTASSPLPLEGLTAGNYLVKLTGSRVIKVKRLVVK